MRVLDGSKSSIISIHALLAESDSALACLVGFVCLFLSTLSLRRATSEAVCPYNGKSISIHALLAESDPENRAAFFILPVFLSTLSLRRATLAFCPFCIVHADFYPRSPCGERQRGLGQIPGRHHFYPRSPCGERRLAVRAEVGDFDISIHALLAESDGQGGDALDGVFQFLSTLSLRRATCLIIFASTCS